MIKVLAVSSARDVMGTEHSLLNVAPWLSATSVEMMLASRGGGSFEELWRRLGLSFYELELPERQGFRPNTGKGYNSLSEVARLPLRTVQAVVRIAALVKRTGADVVHSNCLITHLDCAIVGRVTSTTSVLELHDIVAPGVGRLCMGLAVRLSGRAIAISTAVRDQLPRWARGNVVVISQSVDVNRFDGSGGPDGWRARLAVSLSDPLVAAVGRIDPEKGLHVLIRAVAMVRSCGIPLQLALVGSPSKDGGGYLTSLEELGDRLLGDALRIVPQVTDVPAVLHGVDVLACPSEQEPFGLILLEAQASGVVVVASASGGPLDFIAHESTGMLFEPGNASDLADALARLVKHPALRERLALAGQVRARSEYTAEIRANRFASLYSDLAAR